MNCPFENDLLDALGRGFVPAELDAHAAACGSCSELRMVAGALLDDRAQAMLEAPVPSAGTMWFRMQLRRRREAQAVARRSLVLGQAVTFAIAAAVLLIVFGAQASILVRELAATIRVHSTLLLAIATTLFLAPVASWMAIRQK